MYCRETNTVIPFFQHRQHNRSSVTRSNRALKMAKILEIYRRLQSKPGDLTGMISTQQSQNNIGCTYTCVSRVSQGSLLHVTPRVGLDLLTHAIFIDFPPVGVDNL